MRTGTSRRHLPAAALAALALLGVAGCGAGNAAPAQASSAGQQTVTGGTLGLGIIGLTVRDLPVSLAFYRRLGLAIPPDVDTSTGAFRLPQPNGQIVFWETVQYVQGFDPAYRPPTGDRRVTLEFGFRTPDDVTAMYGTLLAAGAQSRLAPLDWSNNTIRYAIVVDPDGNQISLRWPLVS